jgi:pimeloyl-ACP methyl ester carboxylesterase
MALNHDRRGRGDSADTPPDAVEREIDDIAGLIQQVGGSTSLFGHSSGATLALKAAAGGLPITHLVLYEPPSNTDDNDPALPVGFADAVPNGWSFALSAARGGRHRAPGRRRRASRRSPERRWRWSRSEF